MMVPCIALFCMFFIYRTGARLAAVDKEHANLL